MKEKLYLDNKIEIIAATQDDLAIVIGLIESYADGMEFDQRLLIGNAVELIDKKHVLIFRYNGIPVGCLSGFIAPHLFRDEAMFNIQIIYINQEYRSLTRTIFKELEMLLLPSKVKSITLGIPAEHPNAYLLHRYMNMIGFKTLETHYQKRF